MTAMTPDAPAPTRRIWSYESACEELRAEPFRPEPQLEPAAYWFSEGDDPGAATEAIKRGARGGPAGADSLRAYPLPGLPGRPSIVAEFAGVLLLERFKSRLITPHERPQIPYSQRANLQWIYWGELVASPNGPLALGQLSIGPWPGAEDELEPGSEPFTGITSGLLRAIRPDKIISDVLQRLETSEEWQNYLAETHHVAIPQDQQRLLRETLVRMRQPPKLEGRKYPDAHYRDVALIYLELLAQGHQRRIAVKLAEQLGITKQAARDWIHRARELGYLTPSQQGRPGGRAGHRITGGR
jgi:hypothetical protein